MKENIANDLNAKSCNHNSSSNLSYAGFFKSLSFFFLQFDGSVEEDFLLLLFHLLQPRLVAHHLSLVKDDENDQADCQYHHSQRAQEEYRGYSGICGGLQEEHKVVNKGLNTGYFFEFWVWSWTSM